MRSIPESSRQPPALHGQCLIVSDRTVAHNLCDSFCMVNKKSPTPRLCDLLQYASLTRRLRSSPLPSRRASRNLAWTSSPLPWGEGKSAAPRMQRSPCRKKGRNAGPACECPALRTTYCLYAFTRRLLARIETGARSRSAHLQAADRKIRHSGKNI